MSADVQLRVRTILAGYVGIPPESFQMHKSLDLDYDVDSTELTEIAKKIESEFALSIDKSTRRSWDSGADIVSFVAGKTAGHSSPSAGGGA